MSDGSFYEFVNGGELVNHVLGRFSLATARHTSQNKQYNDGEEGIESFRQSGIMRRRRKTQGDEKYSYFTRYYCFFFDSRGINVTNIFYFSSITT